MWWLLLVEGGKEVSCESWDDRTGVSDNPRWRRKYAVGQFMDSELGRRQDGSPGKTETPGLLGGELHNTKGAATCMNKTCGMRGWQNSSQHILWDFLLDLYGLPLPTTLFFWLQSGYSGLRWLSDKWKQDCDSWQFFAVQFVVSVSNSPLGLFFFTALSGIIHTAPNAVLCKRVEQSFQSFEVVYVPST